MNKKTDEIIEIIKNYLENKFSHSFKIKKDNDWNINTYWYPKFYCICKKCNYNLFICVENINTKKLDSEESFIDNYCKNIFIKINEIKFIIKIINHDEITSKSIREYDNECALLTCNQYIIQKIIE